MGSGLRFYRRALHSCTLYRFIANISLPSVARGWTELGSAASEVRTRRCHTTQSSGASRDCRHAPPRRAGPAKTPGRAAGLHSRSDELPTAREERGRLEMGGEETGWRGEETGQCGSELELKPHGWLQ